jgi:hypothetical protein
MVNVNPPPNSYTPASTAIAQQYTNTGGTVQATQPTTPAPDQRVRISPQYGQESTVYGDTTLLTNPMKPLFVSGGLVFPYTPSITFTGNTEYGNMNMVHTNQDFAYFIRAQSYKITIQGDFTAQTDVEASYLLGCLHFLRSNTKMRFGMTDSQHGLPPPVLLLNGFGNYVMNALPILIESWSMDYPKDVDIVWVNVGSSPNAVNPTQAASPSGAYGAWVPARTTISISVIVQQTPYKWLTEFNLDKFRNGQLLGNSGQGWF